MAKPNDEWVVIDAATVLAMGVVLLLASLRMFSEAPDVSRTKRCDVRRDGRSQGS
jgi:hypothetical protein